MGVAADTFLPRSGDLDSSEPRNNALTCSVSSAFSASGDFFADLIRATERTRPQLTGARQLTIEHVCGQTAMFALTAYGSSHDRRRLWPWAMPGPSRRR
jgi:hypothetical protein